MDGPNQLTFLKNEVKASPRRVGEGDQLDAVPASEEEVGAALVGASDLAGRIYLQTASWYLDLMTEVNPVQRDRTLIHYSDEEEVEGWAGARIWELWERARECDLSPAGREAARPYLDKLGAHNPVWGSL